MQFENEILHIDGYFQEKLCPEINYNLYRAPLIVNGLIIYYRVDALTIS